jgi:predicted permease
VLTGLFTRLRADFLRDRFDAELDEELRYHLERETERNVANGMSARDARDAARRAMGNVTIAAEQARDESRWHWLEELRQDVSYALRTFRRAPAFVVTVVVTIALGLGLLSSAFTFFDAYVLRPFDVRDPHSLYALSWASADGTDHRFTWRQYQDLRAERGPLSDHIAFSMLFSRVRGRTFTGMLVSENYFSSLGVGASLGRVIVPGDAGGNVIVLSESAWRAMFGGDSTVIGSRLTMSGTTYTIVGVARRGFGGLGNTPFDFFIPLSERNSAEGVYVISRLQPGITRAAGTAMLLAWLRRETADLPAGQRAMRAVMIPRGTSMPRSAKVVMIFAPVATAFLLVLLTACANVANIMLARGMARQREIGIRLALGAGRRRLIRQLLTESVLLALPAGAAAFGISRLIIAGSLRGMFATVPAAYAGHLRIISLNADGRVAVFMVLAAIGAAIVFGLAPALQATRPGIVHASRGDFDTQHRPSRLRNALVVAQVTLSVLLLITAGVLLSGARQTEQLDPGLRTHDVVQIEPTAASRAASIEALGRNAGVRRLAVSSTPPLEGPLPALSLAVDRGAVHRVHYNIVSPRYFDVVDLRIVRGRGFSDDEARSSAPVAIVSRSMADSLWPRSDPVGQTITIAESERVSARMRTYRAARVVGVVGDALPGWVGESRSTPVVYYPRPLEASDGVLLARVAGDAATAATRLERTLTAADSGAIDEIHTLDDSIALQVYPFRAIYWVALAVGLLALLLTITGVYGVMSYVVAQRRREFGIRIALGAAAGSLVRLVLRQSLVLALTGAAMGAALALLASRVIASILVGVNGYSIAGYAAGAGAVVLACVIAAFIPSRRAATVNPVEALRAD